MKHNTFFLCGCFCAVEHMLFAVAVAPLAIWPADWPNRHDRSNQTIHHYLLLGIVLTVPFLGFEPFFFLAVCSTGQHFGCVRAVVALCGFAHITELTIEIGHWWDKLRLTHKFEWYSWSGHRTRNEKESFEFELSSILCITSLCSWVWAVVNCHITCHS